MSQIRTPLLLCVALLTSASALAAGIPELRGSPTPVTGVYSLTFNLNLASQLPSGTTITCRARIVPNQSGIDLGNPQFPVIPIGTAAVQTVVNGPAATCTEEIPFSWTLWSTRDGILLSYEIEAVGSAGSAPLLIRSSGLQNVGVPYPANGGRASLNFNLAF